MNGGRLIASGLLATLLIVSRAAYGTPPPDEVVRSDVGTRTIILVQVVELTSPVFSPDAFAHNRAIRGKVLVLKSWWGPFSKGRVLRVAQAITIGCSASCASYPLHAGDELLIFTHETEEPMYATTQSDVWPAAES